WAVHKALAKKAEDRFPTVTAFADALRFPVPEADRGDVTAVMSVATPPDAYPADAATVVGMATPATMPGHTVPPTGAQAIQPALPTPKKKSKMGLLLLVLIAIGGGSGGWWWWSQQQSAMSDPTAQVPNEVEAGDPATLASGEASETDPANPPEAVVETVLVDAPPPPPPPRQTTPTVTQPTTGTVRISGLPRTGGSVRIDGRDVTGRSFDLAAGTHQVVLAANGFRTYTQNVSVRAGQEVTVQFPRERVVEETPQPEAPILGVLRMSIRPTADVTVDGQSYGVQSRFQESVLEGTHRLVFRRDGYATLDTTVTVAAGDTLRLNIRLREGGSF
ncbi:MAG: PEGA domain-containing protein, partial [Gemmatimonadota bacterium]|nr:PEGA domain-containing protein [Gemmatimonadota bacterium]